MSMLDVLDLPQLYTKPSAETLLQTLALLTSTPPSWDRNTAEDASDKSRSLGQERMVDTRPVQVSHEGVARYLTSIVSSSLKWIDDEEAKEEIWNQASMRLSERSGRTAMGAISRTFQIPSYAGSFEISIHEPALTGDDLGLKTWAASYMLAKRLHTLNIAQPNAPQMPQVLELGSGTGLVGLAMAGLGADVLLTDLPSIHPNLVRNAQNNSLVVKQHGGSIRTGILDWTNPTICQLAPDPADDRKSEIITSRFPVILAADSLYSPKHPRMLVDTIETWLSDDGDAKVIIEFPYREAYLPEIKDFRHRMTNLELHILEEGEEKGYDDWGATAANGDQDEDALVTCWWSCWGRQTKDTN